jgi:hypothetical protein
MGNPLNQQDPLLQNLLFGPRIIDFFKSFLGGSVRHFDFVWFRTKGPGLGSPIHCDLVYMGRGTHNLYTTWVPLGDVSLNLGGLMVLEGSHKKNAELKPYLSRDVDEYCTNREDAADYASGKKWWDGTLVSRTGKKYKEFPLHYVVKYPDGRQAYSPLPCATYGVDGEWLIIVKSRVKK